MKNKFELKQNGTMSVELQDALIAMFEKRADGLHSRHAVGGKRIKELQAEFMCGAIAALDTMLGNTSCCITPYVNFAIWRGEYLTVSNGLIKKEGGAK